MQINDKIADPSKATIETAIKIALIGVMVIITLRIIQPFVMPVAWGIIIAVAVNPFISMVAKRLGDRRKLVVVFFALGVIAALVVPSVLLVSASIDTIHEVSVKLEQGTLTVPPPPSTVQEWPLIGKSLYSTWSLASTNLEAALLKFGPQIKDVSMIFLGKAGGGIKDVFMFIVSIAISAALLITAEKASTLTTRIISRFTGEKGPELQALATATIRGVMLGVIGVALIQSILSAIGMVIIGVPASGLWAALVLVLAVIQLPPIIILGPIAAWVFTFADTVPAVVFLIWALIVSGCDGFLKPVLMGRGVDAPMLVVLIGALGGMMMSGIIGLFVGAVVVAISYTLFIAWLEDQPTGADEEDIASQS